MATMKDVATRAGVSLVTVWRALNEPDAVRAATLAKVVAAIDELHYVPDQLASSLRSRQTGTIALLLPTIANAFWTTIARGVEDEGEARGYSVFLCNTDDDPTKEARYLDVLLRRRVEGIVIVPTAASAAALQQARRHQMPIVQVHRKLDEVGADCIRADSRGGAGALTAQLLALGHRRIAYLGGLPTISPTRDCLAGYEGAMARAGVAVEASLVRLGRATPEAGHALVAELLASERPEALCIGNSRMAVGALHALAEAGVRVPDDLVVATFYDIAALDAYSPDLITAIQPAYEIGRLGARRLLERIGGLTGPPDDILLPNTIAPRALRRAGAVTIDGP